MVLAAPVSAVVLRRNGPRRTVVRGVTLVALGVLLMVRLDQASSATAIYICFLVLGAGFGTVMVTATAVIVREASVDAAGVAGGLQQTAMNVGPTLGVAAAATLMTLAAPDAASQPTTRRGAPAGRRCCHLLDGARVGGACGRGRDRRAPGIAASRAQQSAGAGRDR